MKIYGKITLLAIGVAAVSSALTALAVNSIQNNSTGNGLASVSENPIQRRGRFTPPHTPLHHPPTSLRQPKAPSTGLSASKAMPHHAAMGAMETTEAATISTRLNSSSAHLKAEAGARHRASSNSRARSNREVSGRE